MKALDALPVGAEQWEDILARLGDGLILADGRGRLIWANGVAADLHGADSPAALGRNADDYRERHPLRYRNNHALDPEAYPLDRLLRGEKVDEMVVEIVSEATEDACRTLRISGLSLDDAGGAPLHVLIVRDAAPLLEAERRFEQTFNVNPAPAIICRLSDHRYVKVNQGFLDMTGFARDEVLGRSLYDIDVLRDAADLDKAKERLREGRTISQMQADLELPDGGRKLVIVAGQPIDLDDEACMLFSFADLEPHRQAENRLRASEERFVRTFRLAPVGMAITTSSDFRLCDVNDAFEQLTGYVGDEAMDEAMARLKLWEPAGFLKEAEKLEAQAEAIRNAAEDKAKALKAQAETAIR